MSPLYLLPGSPSLPLNFENDDTIDMHLKAGGEWVGKAISRQSVNGREGAAAEAETAIKNQSGRGVAQGRLAGGDKEGNQGNGGAEQ